ncbi:MAG: hypothetical protein U1F43_05710 [Myxococcota bacterium]
MTRPTKIVLYAVNGSGLGHVTRLLAIARWLRRLETLVSGTPPEVVFLTSTEATSLLSEARFAAFKLPSKAVARQSGLDPTEHRRLAKHFVWQTLGVLAPDLLVVDTFPQGSFDELLPVLDGPFKKVLVLRDVKPEFGQRPIFQAAMRMYDRLVVPHADGGAPELAQVLPKDRAVAWVGDVLSVDAVARDPAHVDALRAELGLAPRAAGAATRGADSPRLVYLSAGGGGDLGSEAALRALAAPLIGRADVHLLVGAGPLYRGRRLVAPNLTWFAEPGVARYFPALDAALAAGGYNTVHELLHAGVPAAFFAQDKIADRQDARIARAVAVGAALALASLEPAAIAQALDDLAARAPGMSVAARALVPENGARFAAAHALAALPGREPEVVLGAAELLTPRLASALEALGPVGAELLASGLGQLDPSPGLSALAARAALDPLLPQLSAEARAEVVEALRTRGKASGRAAVEAALLELIAAAQAADATALLPGLVDTGLKKHPLAQEPERDTARWAVAMLSRLAGLVRGGPLEVRERALLYRTFPRLADCGVAESFAAFDAVLAARAGDGADALQRRFQALKLQRRVTASALLALIPTALATPRGEADA